MTLSLALIVVLLSSSNVDAAGRGGAPPSRGELLRLLSPAASVPAAVPADFECAWRKLAFEYAQELQPFRSADAFQSIHDGLELLTRCNTSFVLKSGPATQPVSLVTTVAAAAPPPAPQTVLYVDAGSGSDSNAGTQAAPLQHVATAVALARERPRPVQIVLRGGAVHRLTATLTLEAADSQLQIVNFPGESPVLSSGLVLKTVWSPTEETAASTTKHLAGQSSACASNASWSTFSATDAMFNDWPNPSVINLTSTATYAACETACRGYSGCQAWIWYSPAGGFGTMWSGRCFVRTDDNWVPATQQNTWSGHCTAPPVPPNIFVADLTAGGTPLPPRVTSSNDFVLTLLTSPDGGRSTSRAIRARYPNADPERNLFPVGWTSGGTRLSPACNPALSNVTHVPLPNNYGPGMFTDYYWGEGGTCDRFMDGEWLNGPTTSSYWCQPNGRTANCDYYVGSPEGIIAELPHAPYTSDVAANGGVLHYWRQGHWFSMMVRINGSSTDANNSTKLTWSYGAFQGAEGDRSGEDWFIEHVHEELDAPREFYFDAATQRLYYFHNASQGTPPPADWTFEAPMLACLINVSGTATSPVTDIYISGITFTGAAASYLMAHGIPSGGDWGLSRMGAIRIEGAQGISIMNSTFTRLDGNAIFLSGYTRNVSIDANDFVWLGESAVASWGKTDGVDARAGTQPWFTSVTRNLCHEIGMYEKQVSCYFGATSASATIAENIFFNMPRAAINFNDDMAGGSSVLRNLVWNTCRESQDHGPFNSWGRVPYLVNWPNGTVSGGIKPQYDTLAYNFIVAGGGANGGSFDHDDGSSFYLDHHNFEVYGGHKSDFDGHAKRSYSNVMAFANVCGSRCLSIMNLPHDAADDFFAEGYWNNTCILTNANDAYLDLGSPCTADSTLTNRIILGHNTILVPGQQTSVSCGKTYTMAEWLALGLDVGTTVGEVPPTSDIIALARATLGMN